MVGSEPRSMVGPWIRWVVQLVLAYTAFLSDFEASEQELRRERSGGQGISLRVYWIFIRRKWN